MEILPTRLRMARTTLSAAIIEVLGLPGSVRPMNSRTKRPKAPSASMRCTLPGAAGSAISVAAVASRPSPASAMVAATLAFCGKRRAASPALPR
jgi:hypothetical protein